MDIVLNQHPAKEMKSNSVNQEILVTTQMRSYTQE